jgi:hypothetical protein
VLLQGRVAGDILVKEDEDAFDIVSFSPPSLVVLTPLLFDTNPVALAKVDQDKRVRLAVDHQVTVGDVLVDDAVLEIQVVNSLYPIALAT